MPAATRPRTRLLIVDPALASLEGHSYHYDLAVAAAARGKFDSVAIYAARTFPVSAANPAAVLPIPAPDSYDRLQESVRRFFSPRRRAGAARARGDGRPGRSAPGLLRSGLLALSKNARALIPVTSVRRILASLRLSAEDQVDVFLPTAGILDIVGIDMLAGRAGRLPRARVRFHLIVRSEVDIFLSGAEPAAAFRSRLTRMASRRTPSIRFYTDSVDLAGHYRQFTGLDRQFLVLPIPLYIQPAHLAARTGGRTAETFRISMLGPPRIEKGFTALSELVPLLPPRIGTARLHLAVQITREPADPAVRAAMDWLGSFAKTAGGREPVIEILDGPVGEDAYFGRLARTDLLLAPYIAPRYRLSTSGVFVEALKFGVPTVTLRGTWIAGQIEAAAVQGLKIGEVAGALSEIPALLPKMLTQLARYRSDIARYLEARPDCYSAARLVDILSGGPGPD